VRYYIYIYIYIIVLARVRGRQGSRCAEVDEPIHLQISLSIFQSLHYRSSEIPYPAPVTTLTTTYRPAFYYVFIVYIILYAAGFNYIYFFNTKNITEKINIYFAMTTHLGSRCFRDYIKFNMGNSLLKLVIAAIYLCIKV